MHVEVATFCDDKHAWGATAQYTTKYLYTVCYLYNHVYAWLLHANAYT